MAIFAVGKVILLVYLPKRMPSATVLVKTYKTLHPGDLICPHLRLHLRKEVSPEGHADTHSTSTLDSAVSDFHPEDIW